jgi:intracellular sulfur oxidation DsrE/DsrF family protein
MIQRRLLIQAGLLAAALPFADGAFAHTSSVGRHRVVIQISDNDPVKWNLALNNAKNLQEDVGPNNVDIEIVAYGPGIGMLKLESPTGARIAEAMKANVKVLACENTMRGQKLTRDDMLTGISYVPAGVTEIIKKQSEGWAYLRP